MELLAGVHDLSRSCRHAARVQRAPTGRRASSFIYGLAIDPIEFTFATASRKLVRLQGRVPPKLRDGNALKTFDTSVEYDYAASGYR